jgi:quinoprotein glucose dehydrogenase
MTSARLWPIAAGIAFLLANGIPLALAEPIKGERPQGVEDRFVPDPPNVDVRSWIEGLEVPWSLVFLPDGRALVSERVGRVRLIEASGRLRREPYSRLEVVTGGEAGLMGLALHPRFPAEPFVYAMLTRAANGRTENAVVRLRDEGGRGAFDRVILGGIPAGRFHDGGRIAFGPDGMLYIGTGDATEPRQAQERASLGGKILRVS